MLQFGTVEPHTLDVLNRLMKLQELERFYLAGGTALSLYYGHRHSVDLDLFSIEDFQTEVLVGSLERRFEGFTYNFAYNAVGLFGFINDIKVDFIRYHRYQMIEQPLLEDGVRLFSVPDLIAMKIAAILRRGVKKDFWDISELLHHFSVADCITYYNKKFASQQLMISIPQALTYFDDADQSEDPISLRGQTWSLVKKHIRQQVSEFLK